jgi:hypothetical protein
VLCQRAGIYCHIQNGKQLVQFKGDCLAFSDLAQFKKTAATLSKKETGSLQFIVGPQALCIFETEPSDNYGCFWMVKILIDSNFSEVLLKHKCFKILKYI